MSWTAQNLYEFKAKRKKKKNEEKRAFKDKIWSKYEAFRERSTDWKYNQLDSIHFDSFASIKHIGNVKIKKTNKVLQTWLHYWMTHAKFLLNWSTFWTEKWTIISKEYIMKISINP